MACRIFIDDDRCMRNDPADCDLGAKGSLMQVLYWGLGIYVAIGIFGSFFLMQTPYAENPLWAMILLWPTYL